MSTGASFGASEVAVAHRCVDDATPAWVGSAAAAHRFVNVHRFVDDAACIGIAIAYYKYQTRLP